MRNLKKYLFYFCLLVLGGFGHFHSQAWAILDIHAPVQTAKEPKHLRFGNLRYHSDWVLNSATSSSNGNNGVGDVFLAEIVEEEYNSDSKLDFHFQPHGYFLAGHSPPIRLHDKPFIGRSFLAEPLFGSASSKRHRMLGVFLI